LKYNGKPTFEMLAVRAKSNGLEIEFTEPLREGDGWDINDWEVRQWRYVPTADYGGPKVDDKELKVAGAYVSDDRKKIPLQIEGIQSGHVVYMHLKDRFVSDAGRNLWSTEAWYTMNQIPSDNPVTVTAMLSHPHNALTSSESGNGWKLLFDGKTTQGWHNYNKKTIGKSWIVEDGTLSLDARKHPDGHWQAADGGDIVAEGEYENFELNVEWKVSPCGNSGIIYNVIESPEYEFAWHTGPEMQILDDVCHPDTRFSSHRAGSLYDMIPCEVVTVKPAGEWNKVRIIKNNGLVEHWLNGVVVVRYDMNKDTWIQMINKSKFKSMPQFGRAERGKIVLQDHGDKVWFRNIKIKTL
jgi:cytochrome c